MEILATNLYKYPYSKKYLSKIVDKANKHKLGLKNIYSSFELSQLNRDTLNINKLQINKIRNLTNTEFNEYKRNLSQHENIDIRSLYFMYAKDYLNQYNIQLFSKFSKDKKFYDNDSLINSFYQSLILTPTKEIAELKSKAMDMYINNPNLNSNEIISDNFGVFLGALNSGKSDLSKIIFRFLEDKDLYLDEDVSSNFFSLISKSFIIDNFLGVDGNGEHYGIINKILDNPKLYKNFQFFSATAQYFNNIFCEFGGLAKLKILERFMSDKNLYNNSTLMNSYPLILASTFNVESVVAKMDLFDKFAGDKDIVSDPLLNETLGYLSQVVFKHLQVDLISHIMKHKELFDNEDKLASLLDIVKKVTFPKNYDLAFAFFNNPKLYQNEILLKDLPNFLEIMGYTNGSGIVEDVLFNEQNRNTFLSFQNDALNNKNLLTYAGNVFAKDDILNVTSKYSSLFSLFLLSKRNLEAAFPLMLNGYKDYCEEISGINLSEYNLELLQSKINPKASKSYDWTLFKINELKQELNGFLDGESLELIKSLRNNKNSIEDEKNNISKQKKSIVNEEEISILKKQYSLLHKKGKEIEKQIQMVYLNNPNSREIKILMKEISEKTAELNKLVKDASKLTPQDVIEKVRAIAAISHVASDAEIKEYIELIKPYSIENAMEWNSIIQEKIYDRLQLPYDDKVIDKLDLLHCEYLSKMLTSNDEFFYNFGILIRRVQDSLDKPIKEIFDSLPQNAITKRMYEENGIDFEKWTKCDKNSYVYVKNKSETGEEIINPNLKISKVDMYDVKKSLCLGNYAGCCTGLGKKFKEFTAPTYVMNKCIGAIELTDGGKPVGNTMMYFAKVDGKVALVLDNIELKADYRHDDAIRDGFVEYAKKVCEEVGKPNLPIYAVAKRHKVNMGVFPRLISELKIIGTTGQDDIYLDYDADRHILDGNMVFNAPLYRLN